MFDTMDVRTVYSVYTVCMVCVLVSVLRVSIHATRYYSIHVYRYQYDERIVGSDYPLVRLDVSFEDVEWSVGLGGWVRGYCVSICSVVLEKYGYLVR